MLAALLGLLGKQDIPASRVTACPNHLDIFLDGGFPAVTQSQAVGAKVVIVIPY